MRLIHLIGHRFWLSLGAALALAGCGGAPVRQHDAADASLDQRVFDLERRVERLENRPDIQVPYRNREEIEAQIKALEKERAVLLTKYTERHPAVRDIDRSLLILVNQRKLLEK
jgi:hypothetical protein